MSTLKLSKTDTDPRWGANNRDKKAFTILQTVRELTSVDTINSVWLDIGCGSGGISAHLAPHVKTITGVDPESWSRWNGFILQHSNLQFQNESIESLSCEDNSIDIVICNQVYEHVPDPELLIKQIYRVLKPGGACYFAGPNLLFPIEPHVFWPFVHWIPREMAMRIMTLLGSKKATSLDAYSANYWTLCKWLKQFKTTNALPHILKSPKKFRRKGVAWSMVSFLPITILRKLTFLSPSFIFVIIK